MADSEIIELLLCGGESCEDLGSSCTEGLLHQAAADLEAYCLKVVVSNRCTQFKERALAGMRQLHDRVDFTGPTAGLVSALEAFPGRPLLLLSSACYARAAQIAEQLLSAADDDAVVVCCEYADGGVEPLAALIRPGFAEALEASKEQGCPDIVRALQLVPADVVRRVGPLPALRD